MSEKELYDKSYVAALRFLSHKPRTVEEVRQKLITFWAKSKDTPEWNPNAFAIAIEAVIQTLLDEKFLDDSAYIDSYLSFQSENKKKSLRAIKNFLLSKGLDTHLISQKLLLIENKDQDALENLAGKKYNILKDRGYSKIKLKQKLATYLMGKGFLAEDVINAVDRLIGVK